MSPLQRSSGTSNPSLFHFTSVAVAHVAHSRLNLLYVSHTIPHTAPCIISHNHENHVAFVLRYRQLLRRCETTDQKALCLCGICFQNGCATQSTSSIHTYTFVGVPLPTAPLLPMRVPCCRAAELNFFLKIPSSPFLFQRTDPSPRPNDQIPNPARYKCKNRHEIRKDIV